MLLYQYQQQYFEDCFEKNQQIFDAIAFNVDIKRWPDHQAKQVKLAYRLDINEFRGKQSVQLMVEQLE